MYKIYAKNVSSESDVLIYDDTSSELDTKVISPHLTLEKGAPGSLKMTIPPGNAGYDMVSVMGTELKVMKDDREIWCGRVLQESKDFWNKRQVTCEGELAYLNDTIQPPASYEFSGDYGVKNYFLALLAVHNANVPSSQQFSVDASKVRVTVFGEVSVSTNYENTLECMKKIIDEKGGFLKIRKIDGVRYLDYLETEDNTCDQSIVFGKNLIDFTNSFDATEFATVVIPLGAKIDDGDPDSEDDYLTVASVNQGSIYVSASQDVIDTYGRIEKVVHWDQVNDPNYLKNRAEMYLQDEQFKAVKIEISALDLHYLNPEIDDINLGDRVYVISPPHGLNRPFPVNRLDIPLDQPQNTIFQLGEESKITLTAATSKANEELLKSIEAEINGDAILDAAKAHVASIMNQRLNGYVTILTEEGTPDDPGRHTEAIYISDTRHLKNDDGTYASQRFWRWGVEGLGYTDDYGQTWKTAMTMDGTILGERIAAGSIHGSKISAGTLSLTTSRGTDAMTISVETDGQQVYDFERGDLDVDTGREDNADNKKETMSRLAYKLYLKEDATVRMLGDTYGFEVFKYSNNDDSSYIAPPTGLLSEYTIPFSRHYRFVVSRKDGQSLTQNDLQAIGRSFVIGDNDRAVIRAEDLQVIGMVTFKALGAEEGEEGYDSQTVINGGYLKTKTVTADSIDLYSGFTVYRRVDGEDTDDITFQIREDGTIYIDAEVHLSSDSTISFDGDKDDMTLGDLADEPIATAIAGGTYAGSQSTFISYNEIRSPTIRGGDIIGAKFIASNASEYQGSALEFYDGRTADNDGLGRFVGAIGYDFAGSGEIDESKERVIFSTQYGYPLKFISGGNMSFKSDYEGLIYFESLVRLDQGFATAREVGYGTEAERKRITPQAGQLFFQID